MRKYSIDIRTSSDGGQDQQLLLDENGLSHYGPGTAGSGEPGDRRQQMEKQDGQVAHGPHRNKLAES